MNVLSLHVHHGILINKANCWIGCIYCEIGTVLIPALVRLGGLPLLQNEADKQFSKSH